MFPYIFYWYLADKVNQIVNPLNSSVYILDSSFWDLSVTILFSIKSLVLFWTFVSFSQIQQYDTL